MKRSATFALDARASLALLALLLLACLLPFMGKAIHVDDTVFLWFAQQIHADPLNYFGFAANWSGTLEPIHAIDTNPPGMGYYLAAWAAWLGWGELGLHLALFLPSLAILWGTYVLARPFGTSGLMAGLVTLTLPAFFVSSTTLMADTLLLALWVWSLVCWDRFLRDGRWIDGLVAALLAGLCPLVKYFGIALIPLLLVHALFVRRRPSPGILFLLIPLAMLGAYDLHTAAVYGESPLLGAARYPGGYRLAGLGGWAAQLLTGLSFTGGCAATALALSPLLLSRQQALRGLAGVTGVALVIVSFHQTLTDLVLWPTPIGTRLALQMALWVGVGAGVLLLAMSEVWRTRDAQATLLLLWVLGTFTYATFISWSVSGRTLLPMAPAVGILLARRIEARGPAESRLRWAAGGLVAALLLSLTIAWADHRLAASARDAARLVTERYAEHVGSRRLWFSGHWGFQYYAEQRGARALDVQRLSLREGDLVVIPLNNSFRIRLPADASVVVEQFDQPVPSWITTMNPATGGGFYSSTWGPLPFAFGRVPSESYLVRRVIRELGR